MKRRAATLVTLIAGLLVSGGWTAQPAGRASVAPAPVVAPAPALNEECAECFSSLYASGSLGPVYDVEYGNACYGPGEPNCATCPEDTNYCERGIIWMGDNDVCQWSCGLELMPLAVEVADAVSAGDDAALARLAGSTPGTVTFNVERSAVQVVSECGRIIASLPTAARGERR